MPDPVKDETTETEEREHPDTIELSDEEFEQLSEPEGEVADTETAEETQETEETTEEKEEVAEPESETEETVTKESEEEDTKESDTETALETEETVEDTDTEKTEESETKTEEETATVDYKAEYEKLTAPFKANGTEMQVKNTDDAIQLMQMGANYHKKMAALKPSLKSLKLLEKNELLDPEKLNFLIDLNNKNPEAITKLLKDSNMDPLDINTKDESDYKPTQRNVSDTELDLDAVLDEIKDSPSYSQTLDVLTNQWDEQSRTTIAAQPQIISVINKHVTDGTYDKVMGAVTYERSMGRLKGISDFEAYKQMGDALYAAGQLSPETPAKDAHTEQSAKEEKKAPVKSPAETPNAEEIARKKRKKAASPTKSTGTPAPNTFDPLSLSDEEFEKFDPKHFQNT